MQIIYKNLTIKYNFICVIEKKAVLLQPQKPERVPDVMCNQED